MSKRLREIIPEEDSSLPRLNWNKNPKIGWWEDHDHYTMYHGTHQSRLNSIAQSGIHAPKEGSTAGWVSMTHDPHTAHGYASMHGGETSFRQAGGKAQHVPHNERVVLVSKIPKDWAHQNMNPHFRGNVNSVKDNLTNREKYNAHTAQGRPDHEYYATTELRFKDSIPRKFLVGYMKKQ